MTNSKKAAWQIVKREIGPAITPQSTPDAETFRDYFATILDDVRQKIPPSSINSPLGKLSYQDSF